MRAIRVHEFGDPDVLRLEEAPVPAPVEGEVLVRIQAAGVNPYETYVRSGTTAPCRRSPTRREWTGPASSRRPARASTWRPAPACTSPTR